MERVRFIFNNLFNFDQHQNKPKTFVGFCFVLISFGYETIDCASVETLNAILGKQSGQNKLSEGEDSSRYDKSYSRKGGNSRRSRFGGSKVEGP